MIKSFAVKISEKEVEVAGIQKKLDAAKMKFQAISEKIQNANTAATSAHEKANHALKVYENSLKIVKKASDDVTESKAQLDNADEGSEEYIHLEKSHEALSGHKSSAQGNKTKFNIAKEIDEATAEEATILVDELKNEQGDAKEDLDENLKKTRLHVLQDLLNKQQTRFLTGQKNRKHQVLFEKIGRGIDEYIGRTEQFSPVTVVSKENMVGEIRSVKINSVMSHSLKGVLK